jgi:hypothetical protein
VYTHNANFAMSYDFECYGESGDSLFSGIDTSSLALPITLKFTTSADIECTNALTFAHKDVVYVINPDSTITKLD